MFPIKSTQLPSKKSRDALDVSVVIASYRPDWKKCSAEMNREEFEKLFKAWVEFKGPVKNAKHFAVCVIIDPAEDLYAYAEFKRGVVKCDVRPEEDIDVDLLSIVDFSGQRKNIVNVRPNSKCGCGSGRKAKRCCHR